MKIIIKIISLILFSFTTIFSQLDIEWDKTIGGAGRDECLNMQNTYDGGYIFTGSSEDNLWYVRVNSVGDTLWTRTLLFGDMTIGRSIIQTSDSGYIMTGDSYTNDEYEPWIEGHILRACCPNNLNKP